MQLCTSLQPYIHSCLVTYIKFYPVLQIRFYIVWFGLNLVLELNIVNSVVMMVVVSSLATETVGDMRGLGGGSGELASVEVVGDGHTQQRSENNVDKVVSVVLSSTQCNIDGQKKGEESKQQLGGLAPISLVGVDLSVYPQAEERHSHKSCGGVARRSGFHALQNGVHISSANLDCHILINGSSLGGLTSGNEVGSVSAHVNLEKVGDEAVEEGGNQKGGQSDGHELESVLRSGSHDSRQSNEHKEGNDDGVENTSL